MSKISEIAEIRSFAGPAPQQTVGPDVVGTVARGEGLRHTSGLTCEVAARARAPGAVSAADPSGVRPEVHVVSKCHVFRPACVTLGILSLLGEG